MARFVSQHRNLVVGIRDGVPEHRGPDGRMVPAVTELEAAFTPDLRTDEDLYLALSTFTFRGRPKYENNEPADVSKRIAVFDTEIAARQNGWSAADEAFVAETLRERADGNSFIEVVPEPAAKPWPGYDEVESADRALDLAVAINADLNEVLRYEKEHLARPEFIETFKDAAEALDETFIVHA